MSKISQQSVSDPSEPRPGTHLTVGLEDLDDPDKAPFRRGHLTFVTALPRVGKTALAMHAASAVAKNSKGLVLFFHLNLGIYSDIEKESELVSGVRWSTLPWKSMSDAESVAQACAVAAGKKLPLLLTEGREGGIEELEAAVQRISGKFSLPMVVLDDFVSLNDMKVSMTVDEIEDIFMRLKHLAKECDTSLVVLSPVTLTLLRDKSFWASSTNLTALGVATKLADHILLLNRDTVSPRSNPTPEILEISGYSTAAQEGYIFWVQYHRHNHRIEDLADETLHASL